jgi:signal transduction histidine kinase
VDQTRISGQPVELVEEGERPALPVGVSLAMYRVVQEGLTNAVKYAAGQPTVVRADYQGGHVAVEVTNAAAQVPVPGRASRDLSGGRGLTGLRERVGLLGGEMMAGEQPDGRFRLRAVIPLTGDT